MATSPQPKTGLPRVTAEFQEKLIGEISRRSPLWDPTDAAYQNGAAIEELWYEVAEAMGVPVHVVRSKWKNLRDTYRREKKKLLSKKQSRKKKKPWTYTAHMSFIDPFVDVGRVWSGEESESDTNNNNNTCKAIDDSWQTANTGLNLSPDLDDLDDGAADAGRDASLSISPGATSSSFLDRPIKQEQTDGETRTQLITKFPGFRRRKRMVGKVVGLQSSPLIKKLRPSPKTERRSYGVSEESEEDNITCFSKHIASEMRLIKDPNMLALAKYKISQALFEAQLGVLAISAGNSHEQTSSRHSPSHTSAYPHIASATAFPTPTESYDSTSTCNGSEVIIMPTT